MRIALTAVTPHGPRDLVVDGDDATTVAGLAHVLGAVLDGQSNVVRLPRTGRTRRTPHPNAPQLWHDGHPLDPGAKASTLLRDGDVITLDPRAAPATVRAEPHGVTELRVIGGPAAGTVHRLGFGVAVIGSGQDCAAAVPDPQLEEQAVRLRVSPKGTTVKAARDVAATLDDEPLTQESEWPEGVVLRAGSSVFAIRIPEPPDAHLEPLAGGGLAYNRPPRLRPPDRQRRMEVPVEPKRGEHMRLQLLAAILPGVFGVALAWAFKQWFYLLFALMTPMIMVGQWWSDRRHGRKQHRRAMKEYRQRVKEWAADLERARAVDQTERRALSPDPAEVLLTATGPRRRLWERRIHDADALRLRLGLADQPAELQMVPERGAPSDAEMPDPPTSRSVPVHLDLPALGVVGLTGPRTLTTATARWLLAQSATLHSPRDLAIVVLSTGDTDEWNWVRWLPHTAPREAEDCVALVSADPDTAAKRIAELVAKIGSRDPSASTSSEGFFSSLSTANAPAGDERPYNILVVLDGARALRSLPGMPQVLRQGPPRGIYTLAIDDEQRLLPEECATVIALDPERPCLLGIHGGAMEILADQVSPIWCDRLARALAPIRDVSREDSDILLPDSARLLDLLHLPNPAGERIAALWRRGGRMTRVPIGLSGDGVFSVDLSLDGPHGLIAGTTGAGKSELLQTLISALALGNRPDEMTFVLIDYKGGSAFKDCARLPHTVGMVTDLDGHLTERALESLGAELRRRERLLLDAGAKDIEDYHDLSGGLRGADPPATPPMPRLVLIIDEFAALVGELPDFVAGLVDIARRGRSLGVHLILATQRPAGVVTADIQANTSLRIALRVTDANESTDVIDCGDAARISKSTPGRCYVKSGVGAPVAVQTARVGGRRTNESRPSAITPPRVVTVAWPQLGRALPAGTASADSSDETLVTDLGVLVDAIREAAALLGIASQPSPWLPPLPEVVTLEAIGLPSSEGEVAPLPYGVTDLPWEQARRPLTLDPAHGGHVLVAGTARTGRSTALRTLAGAIAATASPADVHIYGVDCGSGSLLPLLGLPHCGAVVTREQLDRVERLLTRLRTEVGRRQQELAKAGYASLAEARAAGDRTPWMFLLLDRWEGYFAAFENYDYGRLVDGMLQLLREGPAVGLRAVVTSDRSGLLGQISTVFDERLVLRMADPTDTAIIGVPLRSIPSWQPPGRAIAGGGPSGLIESQIALLAEDASGPGQVAALQALGRAARSRFPRPTAAQRPLRVDALPVRLTTDEAMRLDPEFEPPSALWALVGAGGDELLPCGVDLIGHGPGCVVAGPPRSGRSSVLLTMATSLLSREVAVVLITPRRSPLRDLAGRDGVLDVLGSDADPESLTRWFKGRERYVVFVDDAELLSVDSSLGQALESVLVSGRDNEHGLVVAGTTSDMIQAYRGYLGEAKKARTGVLLSVQSPNDGEVFAVRLPRNAGGGPPGRGLLVQMGQVTPIQAAVPE